MREKPELGDGEIIDCLRDNYAIQVTGIDFLPLGNDSSAWVYKVNTACGMPYFLKIRRGLLEFDESSLTVPRFLKESGIEQLVAPIFSRTGKLWATAGN